MRHLGTVKWYRASDGTGYIVGDDGVQRYVDRSVLMDGLDGLLDGARVAFTPATMLGRVVAIEVAVAWDNVCIEGGCDLCGDIAVDSGLCPVCDEGMDE